MPQSAPQAWQTVMHIPDSRGLARPNLLTGLRLTAATQTQPAQGGDHGSETHDPVETSNEYKRSERDGGSVGGQAGTEQRKDLDSDLCRLRCKDWRQTNHLEQRKHVPFVPG